MKPSSRILVCISLSLPLLAPTAATAAAAADAGKIPGPVGPTVLLPTRFDVSPPLGELMLPAAPPTGLNAEVNPIRPPHRAPGIGPPGEPDAARQTEERPFPEAASTPAPLINVPGLSDDDNAAVVGIRIVPPDTEGDIGPDHYVQWINLIFAVWDVSRDPDGTPTAATLDTGFGLRAGNSLWAGFGGDCQNNNDGDPIVLYDHLADRWFLSQFSIDEGVQCIAVSTTPDPTGSYFRYAYLVSPGESNDYPKFGLMPEAYYLSLRDFPSSPTFAGAVAFDRAALLAGAPSPVAVKFSLPCTFNDCPDAIQPPHLEGPAPPFSTPGFFTRAWDDNFDGPLTGADGYRIWEFDPDFGTPSNSTFTELPFVVGSAYDSNMCGFFNRDCIPQDSASQLLDPIDELQMYRAQYRHFAGSHDSILLNVTVDAGGDTAGIRWAELRNSGGGWFLHQDGTYAPADGLERWMGSAAMDAEGNIALGYSVSSGNLDPSIRYTSRQAGDPLGTLPGGEVELIAGTGAQTGANRWGDYSTMSVDPVGDCTFWYTQEYYENTNSFDFKTRIGAFQMPTCGGCTVDADCDDGLFCNGAESCDTGSGTCQPGTPPDCDDGVSCTIDLCDEETDACDNTPNDALCDNGQFCDGAETCDPVDDCQPGTEPCLPGQTCNEVDDICEGAAPAALETGSVTVGGTPVTVGLVNSYLDPVVVATIQYDNNTTPVVTRVSNVTSTSFDVRLQGPSGGGVAAENVSYLVVEAGSWTIDGHPVEAQRYTSTVTDENNSWVGEAQSYLGSFTNPVVLGQVMSENDPDFSVFWDQGSSRTSPPSAGSLTTGKTVCEDTDTTRADESVGFVVFEEGHGTIAGVEFEAALGVDSVQGVTNSPPYVYTFDTAFASAPTIAVTTMAGVDGVNGGWAQVHGPTLATTTSLFLSIDEDQIGDSERNHTTEQVAYAVFADALVYPPPSCSSDTDCDNGLFCDGAETCDIPSGTCQPGTPPDCDDGISCTVDSCNEGTDACDNAPDDGLCQNGLFCDGAEVCNPASGCEAGAPVVCDDFVGCTDDACNESTDSCDFVPDDANCDNGQFCDGAETCDPVDDCQPGTEPCQPGETCNEDDDVCEGGGGGLMEWGSVSVGGSAVTVDLVNSYASPVVVATIQYDNNTVPVVTRISNLSGSSFDISLQNPSGSGVATENVSYLVVEEGDHTIDGVAVSASTYTSTVTDENNGWVGEAQSYGQPFTAPVVLGQVMSTNDADWSVFWDRGSSRTNPPSASDLVTGKTVCEDTDTTRADETVGIIVFESGHGTLGGVEFEADLGPDSIRGVTNNPPYVYTFDTAFAAPPTVALATMAGVDGGNGGWAQVHGPTLATSTSLFLSIDEDQIGDTERNHTTEQAGYVVFAAPGSAQ